jgi:hypothetical protein
LTYEELLNSYRNIWNNRILSEHGLSAEDVLKNAIQKELLDQNTHPRLRKSKERKFYFAVKRISESTLNYATKMELIRCYISLMEISNNEGQI